MGRPGLVSTAVFAAVVVLTTAAAAGCASPAAEPSDPTAGASATSPITSPERPPRPSRRDGGARADVRDAVILQQLRLAAERIAQTLPTASPTPTPGDVDPGTNRGLGYQLLVEFGFDADQWPYLDALWHRESGWNHLAENPSSGAYGIPQSLPGSKMAVVGDDWRTNPVTQIQWGLAYISARYGTPEQALAHSDRVGWY